jgi:hypothetical protein
MLRGVSTDVLEIWTILGERDTTPCVKNQYDFAASDLILKRTWWTQLTPVAGMDG